MPWYAQLQILKKNWRYVTLEINPSNMVRRTGMVGKVPVFQAVGPGLIHGGVRDFNFNPGTGCVSFSVLSCVVSSAGPGSVLTTH